MNLTFGFIAVLFPSQQLHLQRPFIREATLQALAAHNAEFDFGHIEPGAVGRSEVNANPVPYPIGLRLAEELNQRMVVMGVQVVHNT